MKTHPSPSSVNIERRIRKHIHGSPQTFEIEAPPGFVDLCQRFALKIASDVAGAENLDDKIKKKSGRLQIADAPFELCHDLLLFGLPFADIKILIFRGRCSSIDKLQAILAGIDWNLWLPLGTSILWDLRVDSSRSQLYNESRIKETALQILKTKSQLKNDAPSNRPPLQIGLDLRLERESLEILLSLGGRNYWQRGHKSELRHAAPLREDIASCLVHRLSELHAEWSSDQRPSLVWNPFCGTGTLLAESALLLTGKGCLQGDKSNWCYPHLPFFKEASFQHREKKAKSSLFDSAKELSGINLLGEEKSQQLTTTTSAWFEQTRYIEPTPAKIDILCQDSTLRQANDSKITAHDCVWLLANPPFGMRLSNSSQGGTEKIYRTFAHRLYAAGNTMLRSKKKLSGVVLCSTEEHWLIIKNNLVGWQQRCEHFTLGGLDIRAVYFSNTGAKK